MTKGNVAALYHCENDSYYFYVLDNGIALAADRFYKIYEIGFSYILQDEVEIET